MRPDEDKAPSRFCAPLLSCPTVDSGYDRRERSDAAEAMQTAGESAEC